MKINLASSINFLDSIKVKVPNKKFNEGGYKKGELNKVISIAGKNNANLLIGEDVIILSNSPKIKEDLKKTNLEFEEVEDTI